MKKKIVLMKNVACNYDTVIMTNDEGDLSYYENDGHVRLSEIIEVDFPELDDETVINNQVAVIEKQITRVRADAEAAVTALDGRKNELLAISHDQEPCK